MVIWLVLLMLALNVVALTTRIIEKYRLAHRLSKSTARIVSIAQTTEPATLKHKAPTELADKPIDVVRCT
jgi:hypothetical protein